ncbi:MAG: inositol monophosphatase family protein [Syntrophomonadaceae bacterium]
MLEKLALIMRKAGDIIRAADHGAMVIEAKSSPGDMVTYYDIAVQDMLFQELRSILPEAGFIGEENGVNTGDNSGYCFLVDPIDGTANFARDYHHSSVSVGLAYAGRLVIGLVLNPYLDELFYAQAGQGAFLNGRPIHASERGLSDSIVLFGTSPHDKSKVDETFALAKLLHLNSLDVRRSGSAALDLCYVAAGRCELFFEMRLEPWDYAAASLIVQEAGGVVTTLDGHPLGLGGPHSVLAGGWQAYHDYWNLSSLSKGMSRA